MLGLTKGKTNASAELLRNIGSIFFASLIIGPFVSKDLSFWAVIPGTLFTFVFWYYGIKLIKE